MHRDLFQSDEEYAAAKSKRLRALLDGFEAANDVELGCCTIEVNGHTAQSSRVTLRQCRDAADEVAGEYTWRPGQAC